MTVSAPPRPPSQTPEARDSERLDGDEIEALVDALIEEARRETRRRRRRSGAIVALVTLVGVAVFALAGGGAQSQTTFPAPSGPSSLSAAAATSKIAFMRARAPRGGWSIWVVNADGGEERQLAAGADSFSPAWSPDGQKIAFQSRHGRQFDIHVMNADGTGKRNLTRHRANDGLQSWSPDGRRIVFLRWVAPTSGADI